VTRVAEARERAGLTRLVEDEGAWERDHRAAHQFLAVRSTAAWPIAERTAPRVRPAGPERRTVSDRRPYGDSDLRLHSDAQPRRESLPLDDLPVQHDARPRHDWPPQSETRPKDPPRQQPPDGGGDPIQFEIAALVRRVFLTLGGAAVRSVLFCAVGDEPSGDVAWQAAQLLAVQSSRPVAFVEDGSRVRLERSLPAHGLITRIGWYPATSPRRGDPAPSTPVQPREKADSAVLGERVPDLFDAFDFVIINATAPDPADLVLLAREVDGVVLLVIPNRTRREPARALADTLRAANVPLLGAVLTA
jgi:hypothetical protein